MKTRVIFRKWCGENEGILALFPGEAANRNPQDCSSYEHVGQHSAANLDHCMRASQPATPEEYADLLTELTRIGYDLEVVQTPLHTDFKTRLAQIRA